MTVVWDGTPGDQWFVSVYVLRQLDGLFQRLEIPWGHDGGSR